MSQKAKNHLVASITETTSIADTILLLTQAHQYLARHGANAIKRIGAIDSDCNWGTLTKREPVQLPIENRPDGIPQHLSQHNLIEIINQCATLERLLEALHWIGSPVSGLTNYHVKKCHPTTSSDKSSEFGDNDLMLEGPNQELAVFEVSDVIGERDSNGKELKDLISLGVLKAGKGTDRFVLNWPNNRMFLVVSTTFAQGITKRMPHWKKVQYCSYDAREVSKQTTIIEVQKGSQFPAASIQSPSESV